MNTYTLLGNITVGGLIEALKNLDQDAPIVFWDHDGCSCNEPGCKDVGRRLRILYFEPGDPMGYDKMRLYAITSSSTRNTCGTPDPQPTVEPYRRTLSESLATESPKS